MEMTKTMKRIFISLCTVLFCVALGLFFSVTSIFTAKAEVATTTDMYCDGAGIRLVDEVDDKGNNTSGIRFAVRIDTQTDGQGNVKATLNGTEYSQDEIQQLNTGILLIPADKLSDTEELTLDGAKTGYKSGAKAANVSLVGKWTFKTGYCEAAAYIYNMPATSFEREFTYRGYYKVNEDEVYYTVEDDKDTRSVSYVALQAKLDASISYPDTLNNFLPANLVRTDSKFVNQDKYLYRVGNQNTVTVNDLFDETPFLRMVGQPAMDKLFKVETVAGNATCAVEGNGMSATVTFSGTGVVRLTENVCDHTRVSDKTSKTTICFEVVNAMNATTSAMGAKENNVVLLDDVGFHTIEVSNGYTLYGNGFTMTASKDVRDTAINAANVTLNNGSLDNVQIICPNPSYSVLYKSNMEDTENKNISFNQGNDQKYGNVSSAVMVDGKCDIFNSYISGGRAAIFARKSDLNIENTTIEGGACANIHLMENAKLLLNDVTLIQEPKQATIYDTSKTLIGLSVLAETGSEVPMITLEGKLVQHAWVNKNYKDYVPAGAETLVDTVWNKTNYRHEVNGVEFVNLGIAYMNPESFTSATSPNGFITDNRTNKSNVPYAIEEVSNLTKTSYVYTYKYTNDTGTDESFTTKPTYASNTQSLKTVAPTVIYEGPTGNGINVVENQYSSEYGWHTTVTCDLDTYKDNESLDFIFGNNDEAFIVQKYGVNLTYTIQEEVMVDGKSTWQTVGKTEPQILSESGIHTYRFTIKDDQAYNGNGGKVESATVTHEYYLIVTVTKTSIAAPEQVADVGGTPLLVVKSKNSDWTCAIPALEGTQIKYYNKTDKAYETLALSSLTPTSKGKQNGTSNYWTYSEPNGNFTLKVTCGEIHDSKHIYGMPVVVDNGGNKMMYFTISSTNGYVSTGTSARAVTLTYEFTDSNGNTLTFSKDWSFKYADYKDGAQYKYSDFVNGTLNDLNSGSSDDGGGGCVTPDTLITLADGSQVRVDSLKGDEQLLVWNMETGMLDSAPIMFVDSEAMAENEIIHLYFSDGTDVKVVFEHGFWDYDLNRYVYLDNTAADYIGHTFAKQDGNVLCKVQLVDVVIENEVTTAWSPVTEGHLCYFVNGMLSMPGGVGGLFNIFDVDAETMTYDYEAIERDIALYGLFTYEELNAIVELPESMFYEAGGMYLKISIAKGNMTMDELIAMIQRYKHFYE